jgi:hypothetical protein
MSNFRFDYRWVLLIVGVLLLANASALPWPLLAAALIGAGGYLLFWGWGIWNRGVTSRSRPRVQYWRGERIETPAAPRSVLPPLREIVPALVPLLLGVALLLAGLSIGAQRLGL